MQSTSALDALDLSLPKASLTISEPALNVLQSTATSSHIQFHIDPSDSSPMGVKGPSTIAANGILVSSSIVQANPNESRLIIFSPKPRDIQEIKLPYKRVSIGRPKGSTKTTVIGTTKRKVNLRIDFSRDHSPTKNNISTDEIHRRAV